MTFMHNLGRQPGKHSCESISPANSAIIMKSLCFTIVKAMTRNSLFYRSGLFGSGCDEYLYMRSSGSVRAGALSNR